MKKFKLILIVLTTCAMIASFTVGSTPTQTAASTEQADTEQADTEQADDSASEKQLTIAVALNNLDENMSRYWRLIQAYAEREYPNVKLIMTASNMDATKQATDVESLITQMPDACILHSTDAIAGVNLVKMLNDAGIPVVECRGVESPLIDQVNKGWDEVINGRLAGEYLEKLLTEDPDLTLNMGVIMGDPSMPYYLNRDTGAKEMAEKYPDRVKMVDYKYGNWVADQAAVIMEDWLQAYPELNCIYSANDEMSTGIVGALNSAGRLDDFIIVSLDGTANGLNLVKEGSIDCTIFADLESYVEGQLDPAVQLALGNSVPNEFALGEEAFLTVTKDNVAEAEARLAK